MDVSNLISGSSAFLNPAWMSGGFWFTYCWSLAGRILSIYLLACCCCCCEVASVVSNSVRPHRWQPARLPHPWDSPGKNTGVGCHFLLHASMLDDCNCVVVWTFYGIAFLWDWDENAFSSQLSFPNLLAYWVHHFNSIIF